LIIKVYIKTGIQIFFNLKGGIYIVLVWILGGMAYLLCLTIYDVFNLIRIL